MRACLLHRGPESVGLDVLRGQPGWFGFRVSRRDSISYVSVSGPLMWFSACPQQHSGPRAGGGDRGERKRLAVSL